ncbi:MAG: protein kinase [bacterium]|nr:protein kinase [bacterium]
MSPPLPSRYKLEMRIGRDDDIEEWFATDVELNRPVLIRVAGPEASSRRRASFLTAVQKASRVSHNHVAAVFAADRGDGSAYAVTEWTGGVTLANRLAAGTTTPVAEFLSNAAGLADGLAVLHEDGFVHGAIDAGAILYSGGHPAKLGGFGRVQRTDSPEEDMRALGSVLESALTGLPASTLTPSEVVDALPEGVDSALRLSRDGAIGAREFADIVRSLPYSPPLGHTSRWSWRWLLPAALFALAAIVLIWVGSLLESSPTSPVLAPAIPGPTVTRPQPPSTTVPSPTNTDPPAAEIPRAPVLVENVSAFDPLGDGQEHSVTVPRLVDGNPSTVWRTERYFDPLPLLKEGIGLAFEVTGSPAYMELVDLSEGTAFRLMWASRLLDIDDPRWETVAEESAQSSLIRIPLPGRADGVWLLWLTDLPPLDDGYVASLAEVGFGN